LIIFFLLQVESRELNRKERFKEEQEEDDFGGGERRMRQPFPWVVF